VVAERLFADRSFGFTLARQEPGGEAVPDCRDLHRRVALGVDHEHGLRNELAGGCRDHNSRDGLEDRGLGFRSGHLRDLSITPTGFLAEKPLQFLFPLVAFLATEVHNELIERSGCEFAERPAEHGIHGQFPFFLVFLYAEEALWASVVIARRGPRLSRFSL
jgi:hypothetical protein